jgi:hypothetical protein
MPDDAKRPLKVFLCHASADKPKVRELYRYLKRRGLQPWLDAEDLLPGQAWQVEIPKALETSDAIIICLSKGSVDKEGYVQKEIKFALDKALEMPEGRIFLIPARLEECDFPRSLSGYQWVDLFDKGGYAKMMKAFKVRASQLEDASPNFPEAETRQANGFPEKPIESKLTNEQVQVQSSSAIVDGLNWEFLSASAIFDDRLRSAFPGLRGVGKFEGEDAVNRLKILLHDPLVVELSNGSQKSPFWWFRGGSSTLWRE